MTSCVQCHLEIEFVINVEDKQVPVCNNPECPNYWLLQLGSDIMEWFWIDEKKNEIKN